MSAPEAPRDFPGPHGEQPQGSQDPPRAPRGMYPPGLGQRLRPSWSCGDKRRPCRIPGLGGEMPSFGQIARALAERGHPLRTFQQVCSKVKELWFSYTRAGKCLGAGPHSCTASWGTRRRRPHPWSWTLAWGPPSLRTRSRRVRANRPPQRRMRRPVPPSPCCWSCCLAARKSPRPPQKPGRDPQPDQPGVRGQPVLCCHLPEVGGHKGAPGSRTSSCGSN